MSERVMFVNCANVDMTTTYRYCDGDIEYMSAQNRFPKYLKLLAKTYIRLERNSLYCRKHGITKRRKIKQRRPMILWRNLDQVSRLMKRCRKIARSRSLTNNSTLKDFVCGFSLDEHEEMCLTGLDVVLRMMIKYKML